MYAHSTSSKYKEDWQPLIDHLKGVAAMCADFASSFGARDWGSLAGLLHDIGKCSKEFQARLEGSPKRVDHATAGGQLAFKLLEEFDALAASLLAFPVMGHHGGLPDGGTTRNSENSLRQRLHREVPDYSAWSGLFPQWPEPPHTLPRQVLDVPKKEQGFAAAFFIRMLFSCLTDADWLDTEQACSPEVYARRPVAVPLADLKCEFDDYMGRLGRRSHTNPNLASLRADILSACRDAACQPPGCFSLTVPTGGGKTFSSLAFALDHAIRHGQKRIIYVIPFTSIIEQNAAAFRKALGRFGEEAVLEHHSAYDPPTVDGEIQEAAATTDQRLAIQNWDAPIIVTTAVQFFESLFACKPSRCRKLHNIANSVVILDEAQMLPPDLLDPCVMALRELVRGYGATMVLCTATQPALDKSNQLKAGFLPGEIREIIPEDRLPELFDIFRRVRLECPGTLTRQEVAARMLDQTQVLTIVNTKRGAAELFRDLGKKEGHYHLSALMYPEHRRRKLAEIKDRLSKGLICRVVSTSLIEAGVDIDFPVVFREETGLDSIAQAAGRCNREGGLPGLGLVIVYSPAEGSPKSSFFQRRAKAAERVREHHEDLLSPEAVRAYFQWLYSHESLDKPVLLKRLQHGFLGMKDIPIFPFREIADSFRFIDEGTVPLIIEQGEALDMLQQLEATPDREEARRLLCKLQSYTVQVYPNTTAGAIIREVPRYGLKILSGGTGYSEDLGLAPDNPHFREPELNIF